MERKRPGRRGRAEKPGGGRPQPRSGIADQAGTIEGRLAVEPLDKAMQAGAGRGLTGLEGSPDLPSHQLKVGTGSAAQVYALPDEKSPIARRHHSQWPGGHKGGKGIVAARSQVGRPIGGVVDENSRRQEVVDGSQQLGGQGLAGQQAGCHAADFQGCPAPGEAQQRLVIARQIFADPGQ